MVCIDLIFISACLNLHETDNSDRSYCDDCTVLDRNNNERIRRYISNQERCICKFDKFKRILCAFNLSGGSRILLGLGAPTPKVGVPTYSVYQKLHENFKKLDPQEVRVPGAPLDPSMNLVIVLCELRKFCINFNKKRDICEWVSNAPDLTGCEMT